MRPSPSDRADEPEREARRAEELWSGPFGDAYIHRNRGQGENRGPFWQRLLEAFPVTSALEVGCNIGLNVPWLVRDTDGRQVVGVDVNECALREARRAWSLHVALARALDLPFRDAAFDLVLTMGVLMHQPPEVLEATMGEIVRCAKRYVLCCEYYAERLTEVAYREQPRSLFKGDYGCLYLERFPRLVLREQGELTRREFGDDFTYWMLEKS